MNLAHSHGTGDATGTLSVPLFKEFAFRGEAQQAQAQLDTAQAQLSDKNAQVDADVRDALLDIASAQQLVEVARSSVELASEALSEAQQRYANGVSDNLAVSQARAVRGAGQRSICRQPLPAQRGQAQPGACPGGRRELQELSGRKVTVADSTPTQPELDETTEAAQPQSSRKGILIVVVVVLALVAAGLWWRSTFTEDTDDAQVNGHLIQVSSRIAGQVAKVDVEENQVVKAGDVIAELDPSDYKVAVENAEAALASAQANAAAANVAVPITTVNTGSNLRSADADVSGTQAGVEQAQQQLEAAHAKVAQAQANYTKAQADLARYKPLVEKDVISKQQFDAAVAAADAAKAALADAQRR